MAIEIGAAGDLVRVRWIAEDRQYFAMELRNGLVATGTSGYPVDWAVGATLRIVRENGQTSFEPMPAELWPDEPWVGVVRLQLPDVNVIETGGRLRLIPINEVDCKIGTTVEVRDGEGVLRVLSEDPVRTLDLPEIDETVAERFLSSSSDVSFEDFGGGVTVLAAGGGAEPEPCRDRYRRGCFASGRCSGGLGSGSCDGARSLSQCAIRRQGPVGRRRSCEVGGLGCDHLGARPPIRPLARPRRLPFSDLVGRPARL